MLSGGELFPQATDACVTGLCPGAVRGYTGAKEAGGNGMIVLAAALIGAALGAARARRLGGGALDVAQYAAAHAIALALAGLIVTLVIDRAAG